MTRRTRSLAATAAAVWTAIAPAGAAQTRSVSLYGNTYSVSEVAPDVHTLTWNITPGAPAIGNSTFIVGPTDVIVVDTGLSKAAGEIAVAALRHITAKPVSFVVTTHWHGDHHFGNQAFRAAFPAARFVAHANTYDGIVTGEIEDRDEHRPPMLARVATLRAQSSRTPVEQAELDNSQLQIDVWEGDYVLPDVLVSDGGLVLRQGERRVEVRYLGAANTTGDLVVVVPKDRIVINGDIAITPVPFAFLCSPRAWIATLDRLLALDARIYVPGHGPAQTDGRFVRDLQTMLRSLVDQVDDGLRAGLDEATLKARVVVTPPPGSVYATLKPSTLDRNFRVPGIESAIKERTR